MCHRNIAALRASLTALLVTSLTAATVHAQAQPARAAKPAVPAKAASLAPARTSSSVLTFEAMDRNADGRLSEEEFRNAAAFVFTGNDRDNDGRVTRAEAERTGPGALKTFEAVDTAKANEIDLPTFVDFCLQVFRAADDDGDGVLTVAERDAFRARVRAEVQKAPK